MMLYAESESPGHNALASKALHELFSKVREGDLSSNN